MAIIKDHAAVKYLSGRSQINHLQTKTNVNRALNIHYFRETMTNQYSLHLKYFVQIGGGFIIIQFDSNHNEIKDNIKIRICGFY